MRPALGPAPQNSPAHESPIPEPLPAPRPAPANPRSAYPPDERLASPAHAFLAKAIPLGCPAGVPRADLQQFPCSALDQHLRHRATKRCGVAMCDRRAMESAYRLACFSIGNQAEYLPVG